MKKFVLLISPLAKNAFFGDYIEVAKAELNWLIGKEEVVHKRVGLMDFFEIEANDTQLPLLASLSFVYGIFELKDSQLVPLSQPPSFLLHEDFVFGAKYKGKTNEMLTQMLINVGLKSIDYKSISDVKLLDPMCGRGTTLLWAMRYGMNAKGVEQDAKVLANINQSLKKWCKIHRQKHKLDKGFIGRANKDGQGKFIKFTANNVSMQVIVGDSVDIDKLVKTERFSLIVSDLPYGVQHVTTDKTRNPLAVLKSSAANWVRVLEPGGVMVFSFNSNIPKRKELAAVFTKYNMEELSFKAPHRMSESILRDVLVFKKIK